MGQLVFQATLGGQVNLVGPNTASTFNLNVPAVSSTIATLTGTETFTNKTLTTPVISTISNTGTLTLPTSTDTLVGRATTDTLTNKTLTTPVISSLSSASATALTLQSAGTTAITIDTSQNVGIGTASPTQKLTVSGAIQATSNSNNFDQSGAQFDYASGAGRINSYISTGSNLQFLTNPNGGASAERMRIDSSGNLLVGTTSATGSERLNVTGSLSNFLFRVTNSNGSPVGQIIYYSGASPNGTGNEFIVCNDSTTNRFTVRSNGGIANYAANNVILSDRREKTNFSPATSYLDKICAIPVQTYNYIDQNLEEDGGLTLGVVAQDVQAIAPELVTESNWGSKEEPKMRLEIYQTDLQYALMKSIQELKAINDTQAETLTQQTEAINALTARVVALESK